MKLKYLFLNIGILLFAVNISYAQFSAPNVFLGGKYVQVGIAKNGSWGAGPVPAGYFPRITSSGSATIGSNIAVVYDYGHDGWTVGTPPFYGDYIYPGTPFEGWAIQVNGVYSHAYYSDGATVFYNAAGGTFTGANTSYSVIPSVLPCGATGYGTQMVGVWDGTAGTGSALQIHQSTIIDTLASWVYVNTVFKNTSASAMPGLYYFRTCDPDNDVTYSSSYSTLNSVTLQNDADHRVLVGAYGYSLYHNAYLALATKDCRAKCLIYQSWPPTTGAGNNLDLIYSGSATGLGSTYYTPGQTTVNQDIAIGLVYNLGTLAAGDSSMVSYAYIFKDSTCIDSVFREPQLVVNCVPILPSGPAPAPTYDTFNKCTHPGVTSLPVAVNYGAEKNWSWSKWTWAPGTGLSSTTGTSNTINLTSVTTVTTYTITGSDSATGMNDCAHRVFYLTILPSCVNAINNGPICAGDTLKLSSPGDSLGATYIWRGPGIGGPIRGSAQNIKVTGLTAADTGWYYVIKTVGGLNDTGSTHVMIKPLPIIVATSNSPICSGSTLNLFSNPDSLGETWSWSGPGGFASTLSDPTRTGAPTSYTGTYWVRATFNGCRDSAFVNVVVDSTPAVPVATNNSPVCSGLTLDLFGSDATPGVTYAWAGPGFASTLQNPSITPVTVAASGTYTLTVKLGVCTNSVTTTVTVNPTPANPTLGSNSPICSGNSLNLTATGTAGATYSWTGPNGFSSGLTNPVINPATTLASGIYSVIATLGPCSSGVSTLNVTVDSTPVAPTATSNSPVCSGLTLDLFGNDATAGVTYSWAGPGGYASALQNPSIFGVPVAASGIYTLTASLGACTASVTATVVINPTPANPTLGSNSPVCSGSSLNFTATGTSGATYSWTGPNGFSSGLTNPVINPANTLATGIYSVVATLGPCSSGVSTIYATVDSTPVAPTASSNSPGAPGISICEGDTLKLFANHPTAGITFSWAGPAGFTSALQNPVIPNVTVAASGLYTVTTSYGPCISSTVITVVITPLPTMTVASNSPVCAGDSLLLTATTVPGAMFTWSGPYSFTSTISSPFRDPAVPEHTGVYTVTAVWGSCIIVDTLTATVYPIPNPPLIAWPVYCQFYDVQPLQAFGSNILWYPSAIPGTTGSPVPPVPSSLTKGVQWFYVSQTVNGCTSRIDSIKVTINPKPDVTAPSPFDVCPRKQVLLTAATDSPYVVKFRWNPSQYLQDTLGTAVTSYPETDIQYTVVATNIFGCTDSAYVDITVHPGGTIYVGDSVTIYPGESYQINPQTNCTSFTWSPTVGLSNPYISNPIARPETNTRYVVTAVTEDGCVVNDTLNIYVSTESLLMLPNAFTPGSGPNNLFKVLKRGEATLNHFRIYDRWGIVVFETNDIDKGWDGTYKGTLQPFGVYVYEVSAVTNTGKLFIKKGNVTLIR